MSAADDAWQLFLDQFSASKSKPKPLSKWSRRTTDPAAEGQPTCIEYSRTASTHLGEVPLMTVKFEFPYSHATIFYNQQMITNRRVDNPDADYKPLPARTAPGPLGDLVRFVISELGAGVLLDARDHRLAEAAKTSDQIQGEATAKALALYDEHKAKRKSKAKKSAA